MFNNKQLKDLLECIKGLLSAGCCMPLSGKVPELREQMSTQWPEELWTLTLGSRWGHFPQPWALDFWGFLLSNAATVDWMRQYSISRWPQTSQREKEAEQDPEAPPDPQAHLLSGLQSSPELLSRFHSNMELITPSVVRPLITFYVICNVCFFLLL